MFLTLFTFIIIVLIATIFGLLCSYFLECEYPFQIRLLFGVVIGLVPFLWLAYLLSIFFKGITWLSIVEPLLVLVVISTLILKIRPSLKPVIKSDLIDFRRSIFLNQRLTLFFCILMLLLIVMYGQVIVQVNETILVKGPYVQGDYALHILYMLSFSLAQNFPPNDPLFSGHQLGYPFMSNFFSSLIHFDESGLLWAFTLPTLLMAFVGLSLVYIMILYMTKSKSASVVGLVILFFAGGLGAFTHLLADYQASGKGLFEFFRHLPYYYTDHQGIFRWINPILCTFMPQRTFTIGLPIVLTSLLLSYRTLDNDSSKGKVDLAFAGALAGSCFLFHAHSFIVIFFALGPLLFFQFQRRWFYFYIPAIIIAMPQINFLWQQSNSAGQSIRYQFGWMAKNQNIIDFWYYNAGIFPTLFLVASCYFFLKEPELRKRYFLRYSPFLLLFILTNLFAFFPWDWDNYKFILYSFIFSIPPVALLLDRLLLSKKIPLIMASASCLLVLCLSGALDIFRFVSNEQLFRTIWGREEIEIGRYLRNNTNSDDIFLIAPIKNSPINLAGRQALVGDWAHIYTHGTSNLSVRYADALSILKGQKYASELLKLYKVDYALIGEVAIKDYDANESFFKENYLEVAKFKSYSLYKIDSIPENKTTALAFKPVKNPSELKTGLQATIWNSANFEGDTLFNGVNSKLEFEHFLENTKPYQSPFSIVWKGYLYIEKPGIYSFELASDDGSYLLINNHLVIDNGGNHHVKKEIQKIECLEQGYYALELKYFDTASRAILSLKIRDNNQKVLPIEPYLFH